jgi:hypothetical protein
MIKVKALRMGFYGNLRRREGQEFEIKSMADIGTWMEVLEGGPQPEVVEKPAAPAVVLPVVQHDPVAEELAKKAAEELAGRKAVAEEMMNQAVAAKEALKSNSSKADKAAAAELMTLAEKMAEDIVLEETY